MTLVQSGFAFLCSIQPPPIDAVADDQVEISRRKMATQLLEPADDVLLRTEPATIRVGFDCPVALRREVAFVVLRIEFAPHEQHSLDASKGCVVGENNRLKDTAILGLKRTACTRQCAYDLPPRQPAHDGPAQRCRAWPRPTGNHLRAPRSAGHREPGALTTIAAGQPNDPGLVTPRRCKRHFIRGAALWERVRIPQPPRGMASYRPTPGLRAGRAHAVFRARWPL